MNWALPPPTLEKLLKLRPGGQALGADAGAAAGGYGAGAGGAGAGAGAGGALGLGCPGLSPVEVTFEVFLVLHPPEVVQWYEDAQDVVVVAVHKFCRSIGLT